MYRRKKRKSERGSDFESVNCDRVFHAESEFRFGPVLSLN